MDLQDEKFSFGALTRTIIGCSFEVINEPGTGLIESVDDKALIIAMIDAGLHVQSQKSIQVHFRPTILGEFYADLLVDKKVLIELKSVKAILPEHQAPAPQPEYPVHQC